MMGLEPTTFSAWQGASWGNTVRHRRDKPISVPLSGGSNAKATNPRSNGQRRLVAGATLSRLRLDASPSRPYARPVPDYLGLLRELAAIEPPLFAFGGVAEAVLLDGQVSDAHGDLDLVIPRTELELRHGQLALLGFRAFEVYYEPRPGLPLIYGSTRGELALELSLADYDPQGDPFFVVRSDDGAVAISMPADLFRWPPTIIDEIVIHTLSPLALVQLRAGISATNAFGPERAGKDDVRQAQLIDTFLRHEDPARLRPTITLLDAGR